MNHPFPPGTRVYHHGQQYIQAQEHGTAVLLEAVPQRDGTYEYKVQRDKPLFEGGSNEPTWWASYATRVALRTLIPTPNEGITQ